MGTEVLVMPKRLSFSGNTRTLTELMENESLSSSEIGQSVASLVSSLDSLVKSVDGHLAQVNEAAQANRNYTRQSLKRQLQSLKASLLNLGQKEYFLDVVKDFPENHDFKPEADRAAAAVESAEEDLKDLKKINLQDEEQLLHVVQTVASYHEKYQAIVARMSQKLALSAKEVEAYEAERPTPALAAQPEAEMEAEAALATEGARAAGLEAEIAAAQADCADMELALAAELAEVQAMQAEVDALATAAKDQADEVESGLRESLRWCEELLKAAGTATGVELVSVEEDVVRLRLHQPPTTTSFPSSAQASLTDNSIQLIMYLHPGSSQLQSAELLPGLFNIVEDVAAAKASSKFGVVSALSVLLSAVQLRLRDHWGQSHAMVQTHQG